MPQITTPELSEKEKKALDRKIEVLKPKMVKAKQQYDALISQYTVLMEQRYPEKKEARLKETLFQAYMKSDRSLEETLAFLSGYDDDL